MRRLAGVLTVGLAALLLIAGSAGAQARPMLRLGSTGEWVLVLEQRLAELDFDPGAVDEVFDSATRTAVVDFQREARIGVDGIVGPITWGRLDDGVPRPDPDPDPDPDDDDQDPNPDPDTGQMLRRGDSGPAVRAVQERLLALGYWLPAVDGRFGRNTHHAVVALQKAAGLSRDGVVGPRTRSALDSGVRPSARTGGDALEVDLGRQLLLVVRDGRVTTIYDTSTGRVSGTTPIGSHVITRQIDGYRHAPLGTLYRPKYFYRGVAIHGYPSVPSRPASHGCVRVTYPAMDHLWSSGVAPIGTDVVVYR